MASLIMLAANLVHVIFLNSYCYSGIANCKYYMHIHYRKNVLNSSNTAIMDKLFVSWDFLFIYLDVILIASRNFPEHVVHLKSMLERLQQTGLRVKPLKCAFAEEVGACAVI